MSEILLGHGDEALAQAEALMNMFPEDTSFPIVPVWIHSMRGDKEKALEYLDTLKSTLDVDTVANLTEMINVLSQVDGLFNEFENSVRSNGEILGSITRASARLGQDLNTSFPSAVFGLDLQSAIESTDPDSLFSGWGEYCEIHPEGTLMLLNGVMLFSGSKFDEAREMLRLASKTPSMFPSVNDEALYPLAVCEKAIYLRDGEEKSRLDSLMHMREAFEKNTLRGGRLYKALNFALAGHDYEFAEQVLLRMEAQMPGEISRAVSNEYRAQIAMGKKNTTTK